MAGPVAAYIAGTTISKRLPDILVPVFSAPYSVNAVTGNKNGFNNSMWPIFSADAITFEAQSPFANGILKFPFKFNAQWTVQRFGSIFVASHSNSGAFVGGLGSYFGLKSIIIPGLTITPANAPQFVSINFRDPSMVAMGAQASSSSSRTCFLMGDFHYIPNYPVLYSCCVTSDGAFGNNSINGIQRVPINISLKPFLGQEWDFRTIWNHTLFPGNLNSWDNTYCIPDFPNKTNWFLWANAGQTKNNYIGAWIMDAPNIPYAGVVQFDDSTINTAFTTGNQNVTATGFGFLFWATGTSFFTGQADNMAIMSPDGKFYAMVKLIGQDQNTWAQVKSGFLDFTIDPLGTMYMLGSNSTNPGVHRCENSIGFNVPWQPIELAGFFPPFSLPGFCGCVPDLPKADYFK